ncbi:lysylphosphatidylglycerol synthase transmembrane domain-containing protein [Clostridium saccharoperbutylacetonicum]
MSSLILFLAIVTLLAGHIFKVLRWRQSIEIYEEPNYKSLLRSLSIGYMFNFCLPFRLGDIVRAIMAGRKMKNGISFSIATVIVDRYFDVIVVGFLFFIFSFTGVSTNISVDSSIFYISLTVVLLLVSVIFVKYSKYPKIVMKKISSIFNETIQLKILYFSWSIISTFKDIYIKLNRKYIVLNTMGMWLCYLTSYYLFSEFVKLLGNKSSMMDIFNMLFSRNNVDASTIQITQNVNNLMLVFPTYIAIYIISPLIILWIFSLMNLNIKKRVYAGNNNSNNQYLKLLPHINLKERLDFLEVYFSGVGREYFNVYLEINRDVNIIEDYSAGSNATTMLCLDNKQTFYRKYAFGDDAKKLYEQILWIHEHENIFPCTKILSEKNGENSCCYDMEYNSSAVGLFNYVHSNPIEKSWDIIEQVLNVFNEKLHNCNIRKMDKDKLAEYINSKALSNIKKIEIAKEIKPLLEYDELIINGKRYKNLTYFKKYLSFEYLYDVFKDDDIADIHGDLTIENIICVQNQQGNDSYYIIDPNTGNVHDSPNLDYGKLLQSLHGGYEFLMKTKNVEIVKNNINFLYTKSLAYDELVKCYKQFLNDKFSIEKVKSIFFHEIIHWLRLMPYKINKNGKRAVIFYAGLIVVLNEVIEMFEENSND